MGGRLGRAMESVISSRIERAVLQLEILGVKKRRVGTLVQVDHRLLRYGVAFGHSGEAPSSIAGACSITTASSIAIAARRSEKHEKRPNCHQYDSKMSHVNLLDHCPGKTNAVLHHSTTSIRVIEGRRDAGPTAQTVGIARVR